MLVLIVRVVEKKKGGVGGVTSNLEEFQQWKCEIFTTPESL